MAMCKNRGFVMIPENNDTLWAKNKSFNLLHVYILERVRSFSEHGLPCFITNSRFAQEMGCSERTVTRTIKLLVAEKLLWAAYNQQAKANKQRVLWIYDEAKAKKTDIKTTNCAGKSPKFGLSDCQIDGTPASICSSPCVTATSSDSQNAVLVYKNRQKENKVTNKNNIEANALAFDLGECCDYTGDAYHILDTHAYSPATSEHLSASDATTDGSNWDDYFSLSEKDRDEIIEDIEMDLVSEWDIPLWYRKRQEIMQKWLKKFDCKSLSEMRPFFQAVLLSKVRDELEGELRDILLNDASA